MTNTTEDQQNKGQTENRTQKMTNLIDAKHGIRETEQMTSIIEDKQNR